MINEILHEIDDLELAVKELSKGNHTHEVINAIRILDVQIDRKRAQVQAFENTAYETWFLFKMDSNRHIDCWLLC